MSEAPDRLLGLLRRARLDLSTEKRAQADLERVLAGAGVAFERECHLGVADIADFLVGDIVVELKVRGAKKREIFRQLSRYARYPRVGSLILASSLSMGLPERIEGKAAYFVKLGEAWL